MVNDTLYEYVLYVRYNVYTVSLKSSVRMQIAPVIKHTDLEYVKWLMMIVAFFFIFTKLCSSNCMSLWNCAILRDLYECVHNIYFV